MTPKFALFIKESKLPLNKGFKNMFELYYSLAINPRNVNRTQNFVNRNITTKTPKLRKSAYDALVCPRTIPRFGIPIPKIKYLGSKQSKGGLHAEPYVTSIIGQVLQPCLTSLLGGPLHRDGQMRVCLFFKIVPWVCGSTSSRLYTACSQSFPSLPFKDISPDSNF